MANRLFQGIIHQMKDVVDRTIGVIDENGTVIACSELSAIGESRSGIVNEMTYVTGDMVQDGWTYRSLSTRTRTDSPSCTP